MRSVVCAGGTYSTRGLIARAGGGDEARGRAGGTAGAGGAEGTGVRAGGAEGVDAGAGGAEDEDAGGGGTCGAEGKDGECASGGSSNVVRVVALSTESGGRGARGWRL